jgi:2-hydroxymuconate-semialdehyde hydrolase
MKYALIQLFSALELWALFCIIVLTLLFFNACGSQEQLHTSQEGIDMKQVSVNGINISYIDEGEGMTLVLVHGIPTSSFLWRNMIGDLSARWRVIALDLPGFGFSDPPPNGDYSIHRYAGILESFLQVLNIDNATLVCHDWGGPIVLTYALRNPDKYERLVIFDTFLHNDLPPMPLSYRIAKIKPFGELFMWLGGTNFARSGLESGVVDKSLITDEVYHRYYMPDGTTDKLNDTMLGTLRIDYADDVRFIEKNLKTIDKPTLIIWGEDDWYLPPYLGDKIHDDIPGSRMAKLPTCGHYVPEDQPELATKLMVEFLGE